MSKHATSNQPTQQSTPTTCRTLELALGDRRYVRRGTYKLNLSYAERQRKDCRRTGADVVVADNAHRDMDGPWAVPRWPHGGGANAGSGLCDSAPHDLGFSQERVELNRSLAHSALCS
jgi:hypothetical protein